MEQGLHLELVSLDHLVLDGELLGVRALSVSTCQLEIGSSSLLFLEQLLEGVDVIRLQHALLACLLLLKEGNLQLLCQFLVPP